MKLILKIAQNEIRNLFYSPVAWFLGVAFWILCAFYYTKMVCQFANFQEIGFEHRPDFEGFGISLTESILLRGSLFNGVMNNLYLFLPLLTMGLISREINNGTIKLLYSSPLKPMHIVLGKYLAIVFYSLVLLGLLSIFLIAALFTIVHVDGGIVLSALLALFLLICAYSAIGIFMSSLSTYQIVSAVATFLIIFVLSNIGALWQEYDFVRELTYFLSAEGRTVRMLRGLITTGDVIYFLLIIGMFLSFTLFRVKGAMESKSWTRKMMQYLSVFAVVLFVGYITSRPAMMGYWDVTRDDVNTIHANTQQIIKDFDKKNPLKVTLYVNLLGGGIQQGGLPENRKYYEMSLWEPYVRFKPDIDFEYVYYYDVLEGDSSFYKMYPNKTLKEIAEIEAKAKRVDVKRFISPAEIRKQIDLQPENKRLVMQLEYQGRKTFLRTFDDGPFWPDQMNVSAAFKRLQQSELPKILFSSGNLERSIYKTGEREHRYYTQDISNRYGLINLGFDSDSINLDQRDIPLGTTALVVADPKTELSALKQERILKFIERGGNVVFLGEPSKQTMLNPLLVSLGVHYDRGTLVEVTPNETPDMVRPILTRQGLDLSDQFVLERARLAAGKEIGQLDLLMKGAMAVNIDSVNRSFKTMRILETNPERQAYNKIGRLVTDSVPPAFAPNEGDTRINSYTTLIGLSRKEADKEQRILIGGDADFLSTLRRGGGVFSLALFSWLDNNRLPVYVVNKPPLDVLLTISNTTAETQRIVLIYIVPIFIALLGAILLIRRKRK